MERAESDPGVTSDQLPEEAPAQVAPSDRRDGAAREAGHRHAQRANRSGQRPGAGRVGGDQARSSERPDR